MGNRQETGERLRQARELKGLSLEDAQAKTKIHIGVLRVLEKGEAPRNVNPIYLKGFLKIYAGLLGLEPKSIVEGFNLDLPPAEDRQIKIKEEPRKKEINFSLQDPQLKLVLKSLVSLVILLVAVYLVFSLLKTVFHRKPKPPAVVKHAVTAITGPEAVTEPVAKISNIPIVKSSRIKLAVRAKESAWIQVKSDGKTVFSGILRRGLSENWTAKERIEISLGDAGGVELEVNGKRIPALGRKGEVVKNIKIGKDSISVGKPH
jgi:cytoskeletal protein RodZ